MYELDENNVLPFSPKKKTATYYTMNDKEVIYDDKYGENFYFTFYFLNQFQNHIFNLCQSIFIMKHFA